MRTAPQTPEQLKSLIVARAIEEGFVSAKICAPDSIPQVPERLARFVEEGFHGQMGWLAERMAWRGNPQALWPECRSIIMLAESYAPEHDPRAVLSEKDRAAISVYAHGRDYHDVVKKRLKRLGRWMIDRAGGQIKVFVDTAPVSEKALGQAAGLGWQGKHTNLLSRDWGNWAFLGAIFTTLDLPPDEAESDHCGSCRACLEACPTDAFPAPYQLDARRCISYLTIEHKGPFSEEFRTAMGNRIYGCDDCLAACPWNKFAVQASDMRYLRDGSAPELAELAALDDRAFRLRFSGSPIKRIGIARFLRNVLYAIGNSQDPSLVVAAKAHLEHSDPTVADAAHWAVSKLQST